SWRLFGWMLVEISDKMGTASAWWFLASILSAPLVFAAFRVTSKLGMVVVLIFAGGLSFLMTLASLQEAFFEDQFSQRAQNKAGRQWVAHRIASGCLPIVLASITTGLRHRWSKREPH
ncbi:hypothetical protein N9046_07480, partial [Akkermansiaceae bacterium]|nr:hypothetical protein [Akkermansiaceae bacterium]